MEVAKRRVSTVLQIEWIIFSIEAVLAMFVVVVYFYSNKGLNLHSSIAYQGPMTSYRTIVTRRYSMIFIFGVAVFIPLVLNILLSFGVRKENRTCCIVWYIIAILGVLLHVLIFVIIGGTGEVVVIIECLWLGYKIYAVVIIVNFTNAVKLHKNTTPGVIHMAPGSGVINTATAPPLATPTEPEAEFVYENPPPYNDAIKIPPWNNYTNPDYPGAVGV